MVSMALYNVFQAASWFLRILSMAMFFYCILTWIAPMSPLCDFLRRFTGPFVAPFQSLSYKLMRRWGARVDFTYFFAMIGLNILERLLWTVFSLLIRIF